MADPKDEPVTRVAYEGSTPIYEFELVDEVDGAIIGSNLTGMKLWYHQDYSKVTVNSRENQDVLNLNNVSIPSNGNKVTWKLQSADTKILNPNLAEEPHRAIFSWTFNRLGGGTGEGSHVVIILVKNLDKKAVA